MGVFTGYTVSLRLSGETANWNADIDDFSRSLEALSEEEIALAKTDIKQAILNRVIVRYTAERKADSDQGVTAN